METAAQAPRSGIAAELLWREGLGHTSGRAEFRISTVTPLWVGAGILWEAVSAHGLASTGKVWNATCTRTGQSQRCSRSFWGSSQANSNDKRNEDRREKEAIMPQLEGPSTELNTLLSDDCPLPLERDEQNVPENLATVAHDARNMVTALGLYCDLLDEPGVLLPSFQHYSGELKQLAAASRRLVDKLANLGSGPNVLVEPLADSAWTQDSERIATGRSSPRKAQYWEAIPATLIRDLAWELKSNWNLLAALAGPKIAVTVDTDGGAYPVRISCEDLTRILVNLVKNAVEAMPKGGQLHFLLRESPAGPGDEPFLILNVEDNGPGVPRDAFESIFERGFTTHGKDRNAKQSWQTEHRGLGLSITRSIIEAAGGRIHAANRDPAGACFQIELPVRAC